MSGEVPQPLGTSASGSAPAQAFRCRDGLINIQASADHKFVDFCAVIGRPDLPDQPRFATRALRFTNVAALEAEIERSLADWDVLALYEALVAADIICSPIYSADRCFADPQVRQRGMARTVTDRAGNTMPILANPIAFSATPIDHCAAPPLLGEHTDSVLSDLLGYGPAQLAALRAQGAIA